MTALRIQQLADRSGVPTTTLRYYEQVGLLPAARTPSGYRLYDEHAVDRLQFITTAKQLQLPLDEIRDLLEAWEDQPCRQVKAELRPKITARLAQARDGIAKLTKLARDLESSLARLDALPDRDERCDPGCAFLSDTRTGREAPREPPEIAACSLTDPELRERLAHWRRLVAPADVTESTDQLFAVLPADRAPELSTLILAEHECCPFLRFSLAFEGSQVRLTIRSDRP